MNKIFDLETYKKRIIDVFVWEIDNSEKRRNERQSWLEKQYGDEFLKKIIDDTFNFIISLIESNLDNQARYTNIELLEDPGYLDLRLSGGWPSDTLYSIGNEENKLIVSHHILKKFLGESFYIDEDYRIESVVDESDDFNIYNDYYYPFITIVGDFSSLKEKYEILKREKQNGLVMVLKRKLEKDSVGICN